MGPGTLYGSLNRMIAAGYVVESKTQDPRRIYYRLTALGRAALRAESERLSAVAALARRQLGATGPRARGAPHGASAVDP
jgi:DNA-binding PadR family transcriptional regulator